MQNEVYIDGCNVAECKELQKVVNEEPYCDSSNTTKMTCKGNDCYFKQLQRAKAEKQDLINYYELREGGMQEDIQYWKNKAQDLYKELEQYKASKQASYEAMQKEWNKAVNELRDVKGENEKLKKQFDKIEFLLPILKFPDENVRNNCVTKILKLIKDAENE